MTREEELMLEGHYGEIYSRALKVLVKVGEALGAERLVEVPWAHVSGISYTSIGDAGLEFLEEFSKARVKTYATCNPAGITADSCRELGVPEDYVRKQLRILRSLERMGVKLTLTCTPYTLRQVRPGTHLAWGESNAVIYVNSVMGGYTNREGAPTSLLAAITGKTPLIGLHLDENRRPTVRVKLHKLSSVNSELKASVLGYTIGSIVRRGVPLIEGLRLTRPDLIKYMAAGLGTSSSIGMMIIPEVYPLASVLKDIRMEELEVIEVDEDDLRSRMEMYSSGFPEDSMVLLGCPHLSLDEIREIAWLMEKLDAKAKMLTVITTGRPVYEQAVASRLAEFLERRGVKLLGGVCMVVGPLREMGVRHVITNSAKAAHYIKLLHGINVTLLDTRDCILASTGYLR